MIMGGKKRLFRTKSTDSHTPPKHVSKDANAETKETGHVKSAEKEQDYALEHHQGELTHHKKRHIYKRILRIHHDFPPGISVLIVFSVIMCALYIILASLFSFTMVLGVVINGALSRLLNIFIILIIAFMIFGISKKKRWAYHLSLFVFGINILNSFVSMFFIKQSVSGILTVFVTFSFFFILMMNLITLSFVRSKRDYFMHHYHRTDMTKGDRSFILGLTVLWLMFIFMAGVLGNAYYNETIEKTDRVISELQSVYPYDVEDYCMKKIVDRDLCYLTGAIMYERDVNVNALCKDINSEFYKYTCFKAIQGDVI